MSKYKDTKSRMRTQSLFYETNYGKPKEGLEPIFTLKDEDHKGGDTIYRSMRSIYINMGDPTEYDFAMEVLGSWRHWKKLLDNKIIRPYIDQWREELEIKLRAEGVRTLRATANDDTSKSQVTAAKYLADKGWAEKKRGTPSKAEKEGAIKKQVMVKAETKDDFNNIFGNKLN